ncbi:hypothetical protein TNCV_1351111 [Trichonephila clavipes]|nr:hypothetical protein TNCV_1351111 [Trichonephila clavipes]
MYARTAPTRHGLPKIFENIGHFTDPSSSDGYPCDQVHFETTGVSYTRPFIAPQRKTSRGDKSGDLGGQVMGPPRPIHLFEMSGLNAHVHVLHNEMALHPVETTCGAE